MILFIFVPEHTEPTSYKKKPNKNTMCLYIPDPSEFRDVDAKSGKDNLTLLSQTVTF